ncbi:cell division protein ZipA [Shewanella sp. KT0246]|uniref:cell division protein ZipA n=1 Tax=Shewanella sp. KT0246 TaxID=2815912 RepID=UPI001BC7DCD7|nr:cell division protein ZipA [Shewanella sp. KT0246]GIU51339.1 cell division protein ZipA [Shewanella sp. KT0246]
MEDFQLVLFVLGAIAIIAVLVHGFWSIRKQQPKTLKDNPMTGFYKDQSQQRDSQGFDADGIGEVRRVSTENDSAEESSATMQARSSQQSMSSQQNKPVDHNTSSHNDVEINEAGSKKGIGLQNQSAVNSQAPSYNPGRKEPVLQTAAVEPQVSFEPVADNTFEKPAPEAESHVPTQQALFAEDTFEAVQQAPTQELKTEAFTETAPVDEYPADFDAEPQFEQAAETVAKPLTAEPLKEAEEPLGDPQDVLVLHVVAREGEQLHGAELLPCLLSLNFKFGDMDIFHRHLDNAGNGKVLFSMANMLKPGVFDPDNMEQFVTQGVVLFMTLPCHGDPLMNFSIMLNSAQQLADDLGAEVMDDKRLTWTETNKQQYLARIRAVS